MRTLDDVGYASIAGRTATRTSRERKRLWANRMREARRKGDTPPDYPNGWFVVAESRNVCSVLWSCLSRDKRGLILFQLFAGSVLYVSALGLQLAVFRGNDDKKQVISAILIELLLCTSRYTKARRDKRESYRQVSLAVMQSR